jgi:hypothetical protein
VYAALLFSEQISEPGVFAVGGGTTDVLTYLDATYELLINVAKPAPKVAPALGLSHQEYKWDA